ncbi:MAG: hypothetical protein QNJ51_03895 [Calothrix sp. MO_167.B12]|nr:hypothetical protein [Calothrix sp. MO_167.B12]
MDSLIISNVDQAIFSVILHLPEGQLLYLGRPQVDSLIYPRSNLRFFIAISNSTIAALIKKELSHN